MSRSLSGYVLFVVFLCACSFGQEAEYETYHYEGYSPSTYFAPAERIGLYMSALYQPLVIPLDDVGYLDIGGGWLVTLGYSADTFDAPDGRLGLEVAFGRSEHRHPSAGTIAIYHRFQVGLRWWETSRQRVMPFLVTGISFHDINDPANDVNGWGFYGGGGVDILPNDYLAFDIDVRFHVWGGEDRFGMVTYGVTPTVGVGLTLSF